ncbi:hypothetical protein [Listeria fleischmannii]|uniref:Uncharacterized protein n=1 Tax=Listeria fleischmannii FSL S10-1203 TaxID=1265822 RepID=W7DF10_9LIST|nr:hypothetical protein [Listeria fleischmannii]EUJ56437.1 hypothetical protein MCOL2_08981 [Listeria fleischmannii FSL S10-1203]
MAMNVMKACQSVLFGNKKMTHKEILNNPNTKKNYVSLEDGRLTDENGNYLFDVQTYINRDMKTGWFEYKEGENNG